MFTINEKNMVCDGDGQLSHKFYLPPDVARGAYFHGRGVFLTMKYFSNYIFSSRCGAFIELLQNLYWVLAEDKIKKHL